MNEREFIETIISLPAEKQNEFFESLKGQFSEEDRLAVMKRISLEKMYRNPQRYYAMKNAIRDMFCEKFYGHSYEEPENHSIDKSIDYPPYMTTIL